MYPSPLENWLGLEGRVSEWLRRWTGLLWCLSLQGRGLVLNQLVLFMLGHLLNTLVPALGFLDDIQKLVLEFFWPGLHWVSAGALHLPLEEGGQGLTCLRTQVHVFHLRPCRDPSMVQVVRLGALWRIPSCATSKGSHMTCSSFISMGKVFRKTSPGCQSSTRTSS
ncbi:unnamed protein product [Lepidochelys olivacea]